MKKGNLKDYLYVCPNCLNVLKECKCHIYPITLIQIDKNMLPIIRELNKKYFLTEGCCEGHIGANEFIYIIFKKRYNFKLALPNGFTGDGTYIKANIKGSSELSKKINKRKLLNNLYKWACELEKLGTNLLIVE